MLHVVNRSLNISWTIWFLSAKLIIPESPRSVEPARLDLGTVIYLESWWPESGAPHRGQDLVQPGVKVHGDPHGCCQTIANSSSAESVIGSRRSGETEWWHFSNGKGQSSRDIVVFCRQHRSDLHFTLVGGGGRAGEVDTTKYQMCCQRDCLDCPRQVSLET